MIRFETEHDIGDKVYHVLPESPVGVIIDVTYRHSTGVVYYEVQWDPTTSSTVCTGLELTKEKNIV